MRISSVLMLSMLCVNGCSSDSSNEPNGNGGGSATTSPVGGWASGGLYVCFAADGGLGVGDQRGEAEALDAGSWNDDGTFVLDTSAITGTWSVSSGTLTLVFECTGEGCGAFQYQRDPSLACG